mmetsp:Transcript_36450/g.41585  ORF Transcript_36450/g.41585 Transcript_36450/m.41585 type:complete len:552 (-) Transcript_36450:68-1723(-)
MTLIELTSADQLKSFLEKNIVSVVTFSAHWCGPCKASKPQLEALAKSSSKVPISIVHESDIGDLIHTYNVKAFPTYIFFHKGTEVQRVQGVNLKGLQDMLAAHADKAGASLPETGGNTLGGSHNVAEARALRLAKLEANVGVSSAKNVAEAESTKDESTPMDIEDTKPAVTESTLPTDEKDTTKDDVMTDAENVVEPDKKSPVDDLDPESIKSLTEEMGFSLLRAQKGLLFSTGKTVESAVEWLMEHQDDVDIDDPIPENAGATASSYKCKVTGKIFSKIADLELYANRTGYTDFEESTESVKPRTAEEKAAKILEIKELLKAKREEREEAEKVDHTEQEKRRRFMGKEVAQTREQMEKAERKREAQGRKREKIEQKKERERIRAELEKDKRERIANKGKLKGRLGVDGYAPSAIQYQNTESSGGEPKETAAQRPKAGSSANAAKIDEYISKVAGYRAGGDGGKCLKVLTLLVGNAADNPSEEKFKQINTETKTYKNKVKPFLGAKNILMAVGFGIPENGDKSHLALKEDADIELLKSTKAKLEKAMAKYG